MLSWSHNKVLYEKDDHVAIITKNRPEKLNAMDAEMAAAYKEAFEEADADSDIRVIILTGNGRGFNPGANPDLFKNRTESGYRLPPDRRPRGDHQISSVRRSDKVVICAVNGYAYGAGFGEALWCDMRVMAESASFGPTWGRFGAPAENGTTFNLTSIVGIAKALEIYLLAEPIPAPKALELGLANWVVPDDQLIPFTRELAHGVAKRAPYATALTKWMMYRYAHPNMEKDLELIQVAEDITARTQDQVEGGTAFREKREPDFQGR
jgi:2-(1,2-epoxy-1,2-dihydrophenyl)acetyl-CoA isomerase